jgi:hypothetical protein
MVMQQLGGLRPYNFGMDLCTWQYWRNRQSQGDQVLFCDPIPADLLGDDDIP